MFATVSHRVTRPTVGAASMPAGGSRMASHKATAFTQRSLSPATHATFATKRSHKKATAATRFIVRAADFNGFPIETEGPTEFEFGKITETQKETFFPTCHANKDKLVVLDCFTSWCGPCKMIYPQIEAMAAKYEKEALFLKLNCNPHNKELGKALQVKVVPTFFIFSGVELVDTVIGAKPDKVEEALKKQLAAKAVKA